MEWQDRIYMIRYITVTFYVVSFVHCESKRDLCASVHWQIFNDFQFCQRWIRQQICNRESETECSLHCPSQLKCTTSRTQNCSFCYFASTINKCKCSYFWTRNEWSGLHVVHWRKSAHDGPKIRRTIVSTLLRCQSAAGYKSDNSTFTKSVVVSVGVSKLGRTHLIFVDHGIKINGEYYQDVLLWNRRCCPTSVRRQCNNRFVANFLTNLTVK